VGGAVHAHLLLGHRLEKCALRARRRAVDLVGEHHVREHRTGMELELARLRVEHRHAHDVRRQQVRSELHALEAEPERGGQCMRQRGLSQPRQVLDQQVAARQQAGHAVPCLSLLADDHRVKLIQ